MRNILPVFVLAGLMWVFAVIFVDGVVFEADRQREFEPPPVYVERTFQRPAAYRLASPTFEQMDHLHHILVIQQVQR